MCGRYASSRRPEDLIEEFEVVDNRVPEPLPADFNVAPDQGGLRRRRATALQGGRRGRRAAASASCGWCKWGLVPSWAKDPSIGNRMINARMETVAEKPAYKRALAARRCLLPADGYFEWYPTDEKTKAGKPRKQPFFIRPKDGGTLAMAGLYEIWRDPTKDDDADDRFLLDLHRDHDRRRGRRRPDPRPDAADGRAATAGAPGSTRAPTRLACSTCWCRPRPGGSRPTRSRPWSTPCKNNGPELLDPLPLDDVPDGVLEDTV